MTVGRLTLHRVATLGIVALGCLLLSGGGQRASAQESGAHLEIYGFAMMDMGYQVKQNDPAWFDVVRPTKLPAFANEFLICESGRGRPPLVPLERLAEGVRRFLVLAGALMPDPIGEFEDFVRFCRNKQHGTSSIAFLEDAGVDIFDRTDVQSAGWLGGYQQLDGSGKLPRHDHFLLVTPG